MDIDIVVLWVDGNDPEWIKEKDKYSTVITDDSNSVNRYREWGLMRYWFRSIEKFMPWVRKIHFVTYGHIPDFLNVNNEKIHIVKHSDYMPPEVLPTFNSHAIEMNIHRIHGLSEHFIYFNDDTFILKPMSSDDFFSKGLPCSHYAELPLGFIGNTEVWQIASVNDIGIINKHFNKRNNQNNHLSKCINLQYPLHDNIRTLIMRGLFPNYYTGFKNFHSPVAYMKKSFEKIWEVEPELLTLTTSHKFRDRLDVNQWLVWWWQMASGEFTPRRMRCRTFSICEQTIDELVNSIQGQKSEMICINDPSVETNFGLLSEKLKYAFQAILPEKSSFEL